MRFNKHLPFIVPLAAVLAVVIIVAVPTITGWDWPQWVGLGGKTVWDLAQLIIVPVSLALIAYGFSNSQRKEEREIARAQREQDLRIAEERRVADREIASNREREDALQSYLSVMTGLLLDRDMASKQVAVIAQARTMSLLPRLDGKRRAVVLEFLARTKLIMDPDAVIDLVGAELSDMPAEGMDLANVNLNGASLTNTRLANSRLRDAVLSGSNLAGVDLTNADLFKSNFVSANLDKTVFTGAVLFGADFRPPPTRPHMSLAVERARADRSSKDWLAMLNKAQFKGARYDFSTKWPSGFDPKTAGAVDESD